MKLYHTNLSSDSKITLSVYDFGGFAVTHQMLLDIKNPIIIAVKKEWFKSPFLEVYERLINEEPNLIFGMELNSHRVSVKVKNPSLELDITVPPGESLLIYKNSRTDSYTVNM